jgi:hypothetical protein
MSARDPKPVDLLARRIGGTFNEEWARWFPTDPPARAGARHPLLVENLLISLAVIAEA